MFTSALGKCCLASFCLWLKVGPRAFSLQAASERRTALAELPTAFGAPDSMLLSRCQVRRESMQQLQIRLLAKRPNLYVL